MKNIFIAFLSWLMLCFHVKAQVNSTYKWTWVGGDNAVNQYGVYGQKGVESSANKPGARGFFGSWKDDQGNFWIFGGQGAAASAFGNLNDLWRYNPNTNRWTWMAGDSVPNQLGLNGGTGIEGSNFSPKARESGTFWTSGNKKELYFFGGYSPSIDWQRHGDVWAYNILSQKWRLIKHTIVDTNNNCTGRSWGTPDQFHSGTWPLCRLGSIAVTDGTKAYMFGGASPGASWNDFYMFSDYNYFPASEELQWASIESKLTFNESGIFRGSRPMPGGREVSSGFMYNGKFHLFGGYGFGAMQNNVSPIGNLNDLWRYEGRDILTNKPVWTWISGDSTINGNGYYGSLGFGDNTTKPRARGHAMLRQVSNNQYVLFGGGTSAGDMNDVWAYDASQNIWTWVSGASTPNSFGAFGIKGIQSNIGMIGARAGTAMWVTDNGEVYIFGGATPWGKRNDMWKFSPQEEPTPVNNTPCTATTLVLDAAPQYGSNQFATNATGVSNPCYQSTNPVWFQYTPSASGYVQFTLGGGLSGDTLNSWLSIFTAASGSCASSLLLADSTATTFGGCRSYYTPFNRNPTIWSSYLTAGKTYYFQLSGLFGNVGRYSLSVQSTNFFTVAAGRWHSAATWNTNRVPNTESRVTIASSVTVDSAAICRSLKVENGASVTVQSGKVLTVLDGNAPPGAALDFDGVNDYVYIPHNAMLRPGTAMTIEAWVKPANIRSTPYSEIYRKEDGNDRHLLSFQDYGTVLSFGINVGGVYSELDVPISYTNYEGQWVHVAATFDGTSKKIYHNGAVIGTQNVSGTIGATGTAPAFIGSNSGNSEFFKGSIDEVRVWYRAINVASTWNCEVATPANGLALYYKFNQGLAGGLNATAIIATDASGNNLHGYLGNFLLAGTVSNWVSPGGVQTGVICGP